MLGEHGEARAARLVRGAAAGLLLAGILGWSLHGTRGGPGHGAQVPTEAAAASPVAGAADPATTAAAPTIPAPSPSPRRSPGLVQRATTARYRVPPRPAAGPSLPAPIPEPNRSGPPTSAAGPAPGAVWPGDFPDPFVLRVGATYYAFSTESGYEQVPVLRSTDLHSWQPAGDALPRLPSWSSAGFVWAPAVLQRGNVFVLYYATQVAANGRECISQAVSLLPQGPYTDLSSGPFICQLDRGGSIDPNPFVAADGTTWMLWKSNGTLAGEPTRLWSQPLTADGRSLTGQPSELLHTELPWEQPVIEGPSMWQQPDGQLDLLYSANWWDTVRYAIGWARCLTPAGPCQRMTTSPLLASGGPIAGPGGPSVFTDVTGQPYLAFHTWSAGAVGYPQGARRLYLARLTESNGMPVVQL